MDQGSAVLDTISEEFGEESFMELLFANDLVIVAGTEVELQQKWILWQNGMEKKGLKENTGKTEVTASSKVRTRATITDRNNAALNKVEKFKYLGVTVSENGNPEQTVKARISAAWNWWRECSRVIYDKKMPRKLKIKVYKTVVRPVLLYGAELWTIRKKEEKLLETTEMRRIKEVTLEDKVRSDNIKTLGRLSIQSLTRNLKPPRSQHFRLMGGKFVIMKVLLNQ